MMDWKLAIAAAKERERKARAVRDENIRLREALVGCRGFFSGVPIDPESLVKIIDDALKGEGK